MLLIWYAVDDTEAERLRKDKKVAERLGIVEVRILRGIKGHLRSSSTMKLKTNNFELAEKSLKGKAVSHGTAYGNPRRRPPIRWLLTPSLLFRFGHEFNIPPRDSCEFTPLEEDHGPIAKFRFLYRSRG